MRTIAIGIGILMVVFALYLIGALIFSHSTSLAEDQIQAHAADMLAKSAQGDIVCFKNGSIAVVKANYGSGEKIRLQGPHIAQWTGDYSATQLSSQVDRIVKTNDGSGYQYWSVQLTQQMAGINGTDSPTTQSTSAP